LLARAGVERRDSTRGISEEREEESSEAAIAAVRKKTEVERIGDNAAIRFADSVMDQEPSADEEETMRKT